MVKINNIQLKKPYVIDKKQYSLKYFPNKDVLQKELKALANRYKKTLDINDKKALIEKEREIIFQELEDPNLTILRNDSIKPEDREEGLTPYEYILSLNINSLRTTEFLKKTFAPNVTKDMISRLKKVYYKLNGNSETVTRTKAYIVDILTLYTSSLSNKKDISKSFDIKPLVNRLVSSKNVDEELLRTVLNAHSTDMYVKLAMKNYIPNLLKNENLSKTAKELCVWGAGVYRSDEAFEHIKEISLKVCKENYHLKELALLSLAFYLKDRDNEVKNVLKTVIKTNNEFSPLAKILLAKCNGMYHGEENRAFKNSPPNTKKALENITNGYLELNCGLNKQLRNNLDDVFLMLGPIIPILKKNKSKFYVDNDTMTKFIPKMSGKRYPSGDFADAYQSVSFDKAILLAPSRLYGADGLFRAFHEIAHQIDTRFDISCQLVDLFELYKEEGRFLDLYSAVNVEEFFAQGFAAFFTSYSEHAAQISNSGVGHYSVYRLMDRCPELFEFLLDIIPELMEYSKNKKF